MTSTTQDNVIFTDSLSNSSEEIDPKPFLQKELVYVIDQNGSNEYNRNQVLFETAVISNNGKWADYANGFISIPLVTTLVRTASHLNSTEGYEAIKFKAGNTIAIDSLSISYGNGPVIEQLKNIHPYCIFKQHTEMSVNDATINSATTGYRKDSSEWTYNDVYGMKNIHERDNPDMTCSIDNPFSLYDNQQRKVISQTNLKNSGVNYYELDAATNTHVYYYDCIIRLKDIPFFSSVPLIRGGNIKILLTLNQCTSSFTVTAGNVTNTTNILRGANNPILRTNNDEDWVGKTFTETINCKAVSNGGYNHVKQQCRLYVPVYIMSPLFEQQYLSLNQKKIVYSNIFISEFRNNENNFQLLVTNSIVSATRLIIVPMISKQANGTQLIAPQESIFATEPSTCSPNYIKDFNVQLSGSNVYHQNIEFKYEHFLNELSGNYGVNGNLDTICSSQISMKDYNSNFGYIVVDLSRKYDFDKKTPLSVQIKGHIESNLALDFLCYIEETKEITIDIHTGAKIAN